MLRPKRISNPPARILTREDAKAHLRVDEDAADDYIDGLILAAEAHLDGYSGILGRALINQTWRVEVSSWPAGCLHLPMPDASDALVSYYDADNALQVLDEGLFRLIETARGSALEWDDAFSAPSLYRRSDAIRIDMTCGYGATAADIPADIIHAAKLLIGAWYENREDTAIGVSVAQIPASVNFDGLIFKYRRVGL